MISKALEDKSVQIENDTSELKSDCEAVRMNLTLSNKRQKDINEKMKEMQAQIDELMNGASSAPVITGDGGVDPNQLAKMFASKQDVDGLKQRVLTLEKIVEEKQTVQINDILSRLGQLEKSEGDVKSQFDNVWTNINNILANMNKDGPVVVAAPTVKDSSNDVKKLQEQVFALKNDMNLKLNITDFEAYKRDLKMNELDRINRIIEELRQ